MDCGRGYGFGFGEGYGFSGGFGGWGIVGVYAVPDSAPHKSPLPSTPKPNL